MLLCYYFNGFTVFCEGTGSTRWSSFHLSITTVMLILAGSSNPSSIDHSFFTSKTAANLGAKLGIQNLAYLV